jgi:hypothetical protein
MSISGNIINPTAAREAMGVDWWMTRNELSQAIPPDYTEYIGNHLYVYLGNGGPEDADVGFRAVDWQVDYGTANDSFPKIRKEEVA